MSAPNTHSRWFDAEVARGSAIQYADSLIGWDAGQDALQPEIDALKAELEREREALEALEDLQETEAVIDDLKSAIARQEAAPSMLIRVPA